MINLGEHYMETVILLREALFINGILTNAEIWYALTSEELKALDDLDKTLLRKVLKVPFSTPSEAYYLELGILSIEAILKNRRANYLHYLVTRGEEQMLHSFFITQFYDPTPGDWTEQAKLDYQDLNIPLDFEFLKSKSKESFKKLAKRKTQEYSLRKQLEKQMSHSKMHNLRYKEVKVQNYFSIPGITASEAQNLFKWRVKMAKLGENFRGNRENVACPLCSNHLDNQRMIFQCEELKKKVKIECTLDDIYKENISLKTVKNLEEIDKMRAILVDKLKE